MKLAADASAAHKVTPLRGCDVFIWLNRPHKRMFTCANPPSPTEDFMRPIITTTICALAVAATAAPALAAADYYLRLDNPKGESAARASGGSQIQIESWSWGATNAGKFGAVSGAHRDDSVAAPLDRGSVRVKVEFPWLDCKVGATFPDAVLQNDTGRFEFKDAIVTGCAADSVALNYGKVKVRAWDPAKKEH
jgi:hypothetical protein